MPTVPTSGPARGWRDGRGLSPSGLWEEATSQTVPLEARAQPQKRNSSWSAWGRLELQLPWAPLSHGVRMLNTHGPTRGPAILREGGPQLTSWRAKGKSQGSGPAEAESPNCHQDHCLGWKNGPHFQYWRLGGQAWPRQNKDVSPKTSDSTHPTAPSAARGKAPRAACTQASKEAGKAGLSETWSGFPEGCNVSAQFNWIRHLVYPPHPTN